MNLSSRPWLIRFACVAFAAITATCGTAAGERQEWPLTTDWRFAFGARADAATPAFDDQAWSPVALPHTWNARDGQDGGGDYARGDGWYRKHFNSDPAWAGRRVFLEFDGANRTAEVFLNGGRVGGHRGGFARFRFDVTDALSPAGDNLLAVRVNNRSDDNMIPVSADYTFVGGLYRGVRLVVTDAVHVDLLDYASPGVYVRPLAVTPELARLEVCTKIANDTAAAIELTVRVTVEDAAGQPVQRTEKSSAVGAMRRGEVVQSVLVARPHLWNAQADPYLYHVRTEVLHDGSVRDAVTLPLGLRYFSVLPDRGFLLNGRALDLHGVNRHQERWDKGWAISEADEQEDMDIILELGATAVRQSHYQQSQFWNDLGDRLGVVMWAELAFVNDVKDDPDFFANAQEQLRELIRQNLHHPAICFWSIGNETFVRDKTTMAADTNDRLLQELAATAHAEDPSRLSTYASNGDVNEPRASHPDVIGFNHYFGWYRGTPGDFAPWLDAQHAARPDLCIGMSEYGAGANPSQHELPALKPEPNGAWHPEEWQSIYHETYWQALSARPWVWGKFIWCMFDFASDGRDEGGAPGRNDKGLVTADRKVRKDAFYWYQANWSERPVLHITSGRFTRRTQSITPVKVYSNADRVELWVNGKSLGAKAGVRPLFVWPEVVLSAGANHVEARAQRGRRELRDDCTWVLTPARTETGREPSGSGH